jgi:hypothetical protein
MKSLAPRPRLLLGAVVAALAIMAVGATGAEAKLVKVTGSTTVTPSDGAKTFLANAGVSVAPVAPATFANGTFTFPIFAGFGDTKTYNGLLAHTGGLKFTKGDRSAVVRRFVAVRLAKSTVLLAQIPGVRGGCKHVANATRRFAKKHPRARYTTRRVALKYPKAAKHVVQATKRYCKQGRVIVLAQLTNGTKSVSGATATLTAELHLSKQAAAIVNRVAGSHVVNAGALLGSATSTITKG